MALLVKNSDIVTPAARFRGDIWCEGETITRIGADLTAPPGAEVIDARGKLVFPGFIDPHVHIYLPFMGTFAKDTYESASRAALVGGTTTLIEMVCPARNDDPWEAYELWKSRAAGRSACDYAFHMGVTRWDDKTAEVLGRVVGDGTASFKVFLAYQGAFGIDDGELFRTLELARRLGVIVTAHCENAELVAQLQRRLLAEGKTGPEWHEPSRPARVEAEGVHHLATFAELTGAHVYVVHTSCEDALFAARRARERGVALWVETVIPYLVLDSTYAERPEFEGAKYVMSPPLRDIRHQRVLWNALAAGEIDTVSTDHAPFDFHIQKEMGRGDFTRIPNGIPSVQDRVHLLYTHGVATGKIDLHRFADVASTQAAKLFGLFPRKGTIQPGADADLVIFDPEHRGTISAATQLMNVDYSAFEGWPIQGRVETVTVRGRVQVRDGVFVGAGGDGQILRRDPTHGG
ncbi:MAG TPA: dihydropyrimidinase [Pirellulales bacterium]|jgi:dihydropyrimidinase|nr:dihydropyrimidinase [Pirellulales bacterium]